jgi:hypothetical protein
MNSWKNSRFHLKKNIFLSSLINNCSRTFYFLFLFLLMNALVAYTINENDFVLSPERVMYWEKQKTLIIADLHIGKTGHFRKSGYRYRKMFLKKIFKDYLPKYFFLKQRN